MRSPEQNTSITPEDYAIFAFNAYYSVDAVALPNGWQRFLNCPEQLQQHGYSGTSFIRVEEDRVSLVIAHRGTANFDGKAEDILMWLLTYAPAQFRDGALPFITFVLNQLHALFPDKKIDLNITGHSLGGTETELSVAHFAYLGAQGCTFETPGSVPIIRNLQQQRLMPANAVEYAGKNCVAFKTNPDAINTALESVSEKTFHVPVPNRYPRNVFGYLPLDPGLLYYVFDYSFTVEHPMAHILHTLQTQDIRQFDRAEWPEGLLTGYQDFKNYHKNKQYWDGYINNLWHDNGIFSSILHIIFDDNFSLFNRFYIQYLLYDATDEQKTETLRELFDAHEIWQKDQLGSKRLKSFFSDSKDLQNYLIHCMPPRPSAPPMTNDDFEEYHSAIVRASAPPMTRDELVEYRKSQLNHIHEKLTNFQYQFAHIKQDKHRKASIQECVKSTVIAGQNLNSNPDAAIETLTREIAIFRNDVKRHHESQFFIFGSVMGLFRKSRTMQEIDRTMHSISPEISQQYQKMCK